MHNSRDVGRRIEQDCMYTKKVWLDFLLPLFGLCTALCRPAAAISIDGLYEDIYGISSPVKKYEKVLSYVSRYI